MRCAAHRRGDLAALTAGDVDERVLGREPEEELLERRELRRELEDRHAGLDRARARARRSLRSSPASGWRPRPRGRARCPATAAAISVAAGVVVGPQPVAGAAAASQLGERALVDDAARCCTIATRSQSSCTSGSWWLDSSTVIPSSARRRMSSRMSRMPRGIESGRRLVEDQEPRRPQQGGGDPEPLAHSVRVAADAVASARAASSTDVEHLVDARRRVRRRRARPASAGSCGRSGTDRSAAPRRSPRRRPGRFAPSRIGSRPKSSACPPSGVIRPSIMRSVVVLPAPLGPRKP